MKTADECEARMEAIGVPEEIYAPLVALFRDPYYGAKVCRRDDGVLIGELNIAAIEDACRPIVEWMRAERIECRKLALEIAADVFDPASVICGARYLAHFLEHGDYHPEVIAQHASSGASVVEFVAKGR